MSNTLTLSILQDAVCNAAAIRSTTILQPAGGPGTKVHPPTYMNDDKNPDAGAKYALEVRSCGGGQTPSHDKDLRTMCCSLDSVASQANRREQALLEATREGEITLPYITVGFADTKLAADQGELTTLELPHRCADAILRDSELEGTPFRESPIGARIRAANPKNASAILAFDPNSLLHGYWDSTDLQSATGSRFQRCLMSEIVADGVELGVKVGSRIDPLQISKDVPVYAHRDDPTRWTTDIDQAAMKGKNPVRFQRHGKAENAGKASILNHGNIPPGKDKLAGGITFVSATQTAVLSLGGIRRLRFPDTLAGKAIPGPQLRGAQVAARTVLAALGIAAMSLSRRDGYDLRSGCCLLPEGPFSLEILSADGVPTSYSVSPSEAAKLLHEALVVARPFGVGWKDDVQPVVTRATAELVDLVSRTRSLVPSDKE